MTIDVFSERKLAAENYILETEALAAAIVVACMNVDAQTHRRTDTQTNRHTDTQTHRHTDTQTHRPTDIHT